MLTYSISSIIVSEVHDEAVAILQHYYTALSQSLIYPVDVSQLLYSERCISERTLDEIETFESSADNKKTTLLTAIRTAVFSDHKNLKTFATVLSKYEETRALANKLFSEYGKYSMLYSTKSIFIHSAQKFPEDNEMSTVPNEAVTGHSTDISPEQCASDILRCHYATLSQFLHDPISVGWLLCEQDPTIISEETLSSLEHSSQSESVIKGVLLKGVRHAVHINHHNLEVFGSVLKRFTENVPLGNAIFNDYG